jgi:hypothetical protein
MGMCGGKNCSGERGQKLLCNVGHILVIELRDIIESRDHSVFVSGKITMYKTLRCI